MEAVKEDIWICRRCGWTYPNHHPSAEHRRNHRRQCGKIKGFEVEVAVPHGQGGSSDEASSDDDHAGGHSLSSRVQTASDKIVPGPDETADPGKPADVQPLANYPQASQDGTQHIASETHAKVGDAEMGSSQMLLAEKASIDAENEPKMGLLTSIPVPENEQAKGSEGLRFPEVLNNEEEACAMNRAHPELWEQLLDAELSQQNGTSQAQLMNDTDLAPNTKSVPHLDDDAQPSACKTNGPNGIADDDVKRNFNGSVVVPSSVGSNQEESHVHESNPFLHSNNTDPIPKNGMWQPSNGTSGEHSLKTAVRNRQDAAHGHENNPFFQNCTPETVHNTDNLNKGSSLDDEGTLFELSAGREDGILEASNGISGVDDGNASATRPSQVKSQVHKTGSLHDKNFHLNQISEGNGEASGSRRPLEQDDIKPHIPLKALFDKEVKPAEADEIPPFFNEDLAPTKGNNLFLKKVVNRVRSSPAGSNGTTTDKQKSRSRWSSCICCASVN